jgi:hypothetical protein
LDYTDFAVQNLLPPGASSPYPVVLTNRVVTSTFPTASDPIAPLVGPALNPQINGADLLQDQMISSATPTLSWQAPAVGTASLYLIRVYQFVVTNGSPSLQLDGNFFSSTTSVMVPQGLMTSGNSYCFVIESLYRHNIGGVAPYQETFPEGVADLGSGVITVR